jgi:hypothetical protein
MGGMKKNNLLILKINPTFHHSTIPFFPGGGLLWILM